MTCDIEHNDDEPPHDFFHILNIYVFLLDNRVLPHRLFLSTSLSLPGFILPALGQGNLSLQFPQEELLHLQLLFQALIGVVTPGSSI